ncbi:MAG: terminase [Acidobacteriaceae bacterium]
MAGDSGTKENLVCLGKQMDNCVEGALQVTENLLRIRDRLGRSVALSPNRAQRAYAEGAQGKHRNIVLKARQMGMTTWIAAQFFLQTITHPGTVTVQVAHTQAAAEQIFRIVQRFLWQLPKELCEGALKKAKVSKRGIVIPELDSEYLVATAGDRNAGRGLTITNLHCTELARWPGDAAETLYGLMATLSPEGVLAMESTPKGAAGCFWKEWHDADKTGTVRHFFPWWMEKAYRGEPVAEDQLTEVEQNLMQEHGLSREQIGYRRQIQENFRGLAKQEYAEDAEACFLASGDCYFEMSAIDGRLAEAPEPLEQRMRGDLQVWLPPQAGNQYLVAVDPAGGGTEGDFTAMQVIDFHSGMQCAEVQAHWPPLETAREAAKLGREYNEAMVVVERNNHGAAVLAHLGSICQYRNIYAENREPGFLTTIVSRPKMLADLGSALVEEPRKFASMRLLRECRTFVRAAKGGRPEAKAGEHDDLVLAMAIALAARDQKMTGKRGPAAVS